MNTSVQPSEPITPAFIAPTRPGWIWTAHALARWQERGGDDFTKRRAEKTAKLCGKRAMKRIRKSCPYHRELATHHHYTGYHYLMGERWIFVMSGTTVITCWPNNPTTTFQ